MCPIRLELQRGDIVSVPADVCVSSIHRSKDMTMGPLANHILRYGGKNIQDELYKRQPGKDLEVGQVEGVSPGRFKNFKELIFICLRAYIPGNEKILQQSILECLELAAVKNLKTVAFPALGVGQGYPSDKVAICLIEAVAMHNYQYPNTSLDTVYIVLLDRDIDVIKTFLLMCVRGTTDLHTDETKQKASEIDRENDLMSGLSFVDAQNAESRETAKISGTQKSHMPKVTGQKTESQQTRKTRNQHSGFGGIFNSLYASAFKKLSLNLGQLKFTVRPNMSNGTVGLQLNIGIDISFLEQFIPSSLRKFWEQISK